MSRADPAAGSGAPAGHAGFGLLLLLAQQQPERTVVVSPVGVEAALALLAAGAAGETRRQLRALSGSAATAVSRLKTLGDPPAPGADRTATFELGTCLWSSPRLAFAPPFRRAAERDFAASVITSPAAEAPERLNAWAARATGGLIRRILARPPDDHGLVLANALVFLGKWAVPFDPAATAPAPFRSADGRVATVPLMARSGRFRHAAIAGGQVLDLPYGDGRFGFTIFLPDAPDGLDGWLRGTSLASWLALSTRLEEAPGELRLPRLDLGFAEDLVSALTALGVSDAFVAGRADFSAMTAERAPVHVSSFVHQVVVKLDEAGTRAAATTTITMPGAAAPTPGFRMIVDRPFFFALHGASPHEVLFLGAVRAP